MKSSVNRSAFKVSLPFTLVAEYSKTLEQDGKDTLNFKKNFFHIVALCNSVTKSFQQIKADSQKERVGNTFSSGEEYEGDSESLSHQSEEEKQDLAEGQPEESRDDDLFW